MKKKVLFIVLMFIAGGCNEAPKKIKSIEKKVVPKKKIIKKKILLQDPLLFLDEKTAIPFLFDYQQKNKENYVFLRLTISYQFST